MNKSSVLLAFLLIFFLTAPIKAQSTSWTHTNLWLVHDWYDADCCNNADCKPIESCSEMEEVKEGVKWNGYLFRKVRPSKDDKCHVCIFRGIPQCAYVLQGS